MTTAPDGPPKPLTLRQAEWLATIRDLYSRTGTAPTQRELNAAMGTTSPGGARHRAEDADAPRLPARRPGRRPHALCPGRRSGAAGAGGAGPDRPAVRGAAPAGGRRAAGSCELAASQFPSPSDRKMEI